MQGQAQQSCVRHGLGGMTLPLGLSPSTCPQDFHKSVRSVLKLPFPNQAALSGSRHFNLNEPASPTSPPPPHWNCGCEPAQQNTNSLWERWTSKKELSLIIMKNIYSYLQLTEALELPGKFNLKMSNNKSFGFVN